MLLEVVINLSKLSQQNYVHWNQEYEVKRKLDGSGIQTACFTS